MIKNILYVKEGIMGKFIIRWKTDNITLNLTEKQRVKYRKLCEKLLAETLERNGWDCLDAVVQDVLLPQITRLGQKTKPHKCYATGQLILPGQEMIIIKTRPFTAFGGKVVIIANFVDQQTFMEYLDSIEVEKITS